MTDPFHGMNPYLEHPDCWPEVHYLLIGILPETKHPQLLPKYRVVMDCSHEQVLQLEERSTSWTLDLFWIKGG